MTTVRKYLLIPGLLTALGGAFLAAQGPAYDVIIRNGRIMDGTGNPWFSGDVAIKGGKIAAVGYLAKATAAPPFPSAVAPVSPRQRPTSARMLVLRGAPRGASAGRARIRCARRVGDG